MAPLLELDAVTKRFPVGGARLLGEQRVLTAVDGVSLQLEAGETLGLVGESGCGKSTLARCIAGLYRPSAGEIRFDGRDLERADRGERRALRRELTMVFQDPYASLNPRKRAGEIIGLPLRIHKLAAGRALDARVDELLELVGLAPEHAQRYPHEFSGGQRQRIGLARALATRPRLVICDEPVSALDVSIQAQILNLLTSLQAELGLTLVFIAHDLGVVRHVSDRVAVMYLGRVVEIADADTLFASPHHPYTEALLSAVPVPDPDAHTAEIVLEGDVPSPIDPPSGCHFHPRCPYAEERCRAEVPALARRGAGTALSACLIPPEERTARMSERSRS